MKTLVLTISGELNELPEIVEKFALELKRDIQIMGEKANGIGIFGDSDYEFDLLDCEAHFIPCAKEILGLSK